MPIEYEPLVTTSLAKQIADALREAIIAGRLKVDERLPVEQDLAAKFGVSRPTIREALKRLAAQNLVRSRRGPAGGTFVTRPTQEEMSTSLTTASTLLVGLGEFDLEAVAETRLELESLCLRLAAERREDKHLADMDAELALQRDKSLDDTGFCNSDVRFHRSVVDAAGNPMLSFVMFSAIEALLPLSNMLTFRYRDREVITGQHQLIRDALAAHDAEAAVDALRKQMVYLREKYAQAQEWSRQHHAGENPA